jgi:uncharacterized membrane protein
MELKSNGDSRSALLWRIIQRLRIPRSRSWLFALVVMTIGGLLRFTHLETSVYWGDEVYSSLRIFGHTTQQLHAAIAAGQLVSHDQLQVFQQLIPTQGLDRTLASLAVEDAHIAPLYFVLARIWGSIFGDSAAAMRSLAALFSLLLIPASYYLAMDLFNLPRSNGQPQLPRRTTNAIASWMMILVASSPLHFLMAREARGYSLWTLTTVLSSIFLLRALKQSQLQQSQLQQSQQSQLQQSQWDRWVLFSITMALNFYSNFLAFITLTGYLVYVIVLYWRDRTILRQFGVAVSLSLLSFFPWLSLFITRAVVENHDGEGVIGTFDGRLALRNWFELLRRLWIDFDTHPGSSPLWAIGLVIAMVVGSGLIIQGCRQIYQTHGFRVGLFLGLLILPLPLCFFDRSLQGLLPARYLLPSYIGLQLIVAYALGQQRYPSQKAASQNAASTQPRRAIGLITMAAIVSVGLLSCQRAAVADSWWNKYFSSCNPQAAAIINAHPAPLILSDGTGGKYFDHALSNLLSLNRLVKPATQFQVTLETDRTLPSIPAQFTDRFLFAPSRELRERIEHAYPGKLSPLVTREHPYRGETVCLWQLDR